MILSVLSHLLKKLQAIQHLPVSTITPVLDTGRIILLLHMALVLKNVRQFLQNGKSVKNLNEAWCVDMDDGRIFTLPYLTQVDLWQQGNVGRIYPHEYQQESAPN